MQTQWTGRQVVTLLGALLVLPVATAVALLTYPDPWPCLVTGAAGFAVMLAANWRVEPARH